MGLIGILSQLSSLKNDFLYGRVSEDEVRKWLRGLKGKKDLVKCYHGCILCILHMGGKEMLYGAWAALGAFIAALAGAEGWRSFLGLYLILRCGVTFEEWALLTYSERHRYIPFTSAFLSTFFGIYPYKGNKVVGPLISYTADMTGLALILLLAFDDTILKSAYPENSPFYIYVKSVVEGPVFGILLFATVGRIVVNLGIFADTPFLSQPDISLRLSGAAERMYRRVFPYPDDKDETEFFRKRPHLFRKIVTEEILGLSKPAQN